MSHTDSSSSNPPKAFARVPTEIKALIAALAARQDQAYQRRVQKALQVKQEDFVKSGARAWDGRSINALFCLSREWSAVAAPHVFKTVGSKRCGESLFTFSIAIRYAEVTEEAIFDSSDSEGGLAPLLSKLLTFINLRRISLDVGALFNLLGLEEFDDTEISMPSLEQILHRVAMNDALKRVTEVTLDTAYLFQLARLLPALERVERLEVRCYAENEGREMTPSLQHFSQLNSLQHLSLTDIRQRSLQVVAGPSDTPARSFCADLKSLEVSITGSGPLSESSWRFFDSASTSLERLVLKTGTSTLADWLIRRAEGGGSTGFPALKLLQLEATKEAIPQLLSLLSPSPLRTLVLTLSDHHHNDSPDALLSLIQQAVERFVSTLQELELNITTPSHPISFISSAIVDQLSSLASKHGIALKVGPRYDAFQHPLPDTDIEALSSACDTADDTIRFGLARSARLRAMGDFDGARALLDLLRPLKGEMMREGD